MEHFSPDLIAKTKAYFLDKYGELISDEQAAIYLLSLAEVWKSLARIRAARQDAEYGEGSAAPARSAGGGTSYPRTDNTQSES